MKNSVSRRQFLKKSALAAAGAGLTAPWLQSCASISSTGNSTPGKPVSGLFQPTWESLAGNYHCPEWFRDAKFGMWAHWSAQCVPEQGDWYARQMYIQGHGQYNFHVRTYGHPSKFGFMELDNLWKADKWEPEEMMRLYVKAGAKYFVSLANHHDNFDNYNSKYHAWNSVNIGPKRDIVGTWAKVARKHGLRFGVSNHSAHSWHWFQTAYGYDAEGPQAGVRYDAYNLKKSDGKGKWWDGLDPQELYTGPNMVMPDGITTAQAVGRWHEQNDRRWTEEPPANNPEFTRKWFLRCQDLLDQYHPDLLYFDNIGSLPLGQAGLDIAAHFYNASMRWHRGNLEAVLNVKGITGSRKAAIVEDFERGASDVIVPSPWQTDTCIGDWHYNRHLFDQHRYKSVALVARMLINVVSKNGNLLLSIPVRGNGTIDPDEVAFLEGMAKWIAVNGEGIYSTRPWKIAGEGPMRAGGGMFNEGRSNNYTAADIRFTTKRDALYAFIMDWPDETPTVIKALATNSPQLQGQKIARVTLLGHHGKLDWKQDENGLTVKMPPHQPCEHAFALKISGLKLS
jgi:alpha-L-fucosidase